MVKDVADTAAPYVKRGIETASEVAGPVVKAAEPVVKVGAPLQQAPFRSTVTAGQSFLYNAGKFARWLVRRTHAQLQVMS